MYKIYHGFCKLVKKSLRDVLGGVSQKKQKNFVSFVIIFIFAPSYGIVMYI